ncbi:MAG: Succinate--CoA ligase [ADP-forming] subunit beta [Planctomycetes bacterium]|nr:Succinate--CoA ligase [ADP-forming] subunit beta [Planctomycetota bacterium]
MKLHEYQAKDALRAFGVATLPGAVCTTADECEKAAKDLGGGLVVVKAQVHAGGRGKAGGVKLAAGPAEAREKGAKILGMKLVSPQTGPDGVIVRKVLVTAACDIAREHYVAVTLDRSVGLPVLMACKEGGVEIEEVAARDPSAIRKVHFRADEGLAAFQARQVAFALDLTGPLMGQTVALLQALCRAFVQRDCSLLEVNPLCVTKDGKLVALDAKMAIDENAGYRQKDLAAAEDRSEMDPTEQRAKELDLAYIPLDGTIGCLVNGAGLAMATMDIVKHHGGGPANFLDVGGGASKEKVTEAFKIILADPQVKAILVNIFGGIMKCDVLAEGVVAAAREIGMKVPLVVRLEGTNVERGRQILAESGLRLTVAKDMTDAALKVVAAAKGA